MAVSLTIEERKQEAARQRRLREEGIAGGHAVAGVAGEAPGAIQRAAVAGRRSMQEQAARALAAGLGTGGPITSGANLAAARQSALSLGTQLGEYETAAALREQEAREAAAGQRLAATALEAEAGSEVAARQKKVADLRAEVNDIIDRYRSGSMWLPDDEEGAARDIRELAAIQEDPQIRKWLYDLARQAAADI